MNSFRGTIHGGPVVDAFFVSVPFSLVLFPGLPEFLVGRSPPAGHLPIHQPLQALLLFLEFRVCKLGPVGTNGQVLDADIHTDGGFWRGTRGKGLAADLDLENDKIISDLIPADRDG